MDISRDVVMDLLTLVEAGEASEDSKALVESCLAQDPELARAAKARMPRLSSPDIPAPLTKEVEMKTLERAKKLLNWRSVALACGIFFAVAPVTYSANTKTWSWTLLESPLGVLLSAVLAAVCWTVFFWIRHSLRAK